MLTYYKSYETSYIIYFKNILLRAVTEGFLQLHESRIQRRPPRRVCACEILHLLTQEGDVAAGFNFSFRRFQHQVRGKRPYDTTDHVEVDIFRIFDVTAALNIAVNVLILVFVFAAHTPNVIAVRLR